MIEYIEGRIVHKSDDHVIVSAGGVGYGLDVTGPTFRAMGDAGTNTAVWVYTHVREDAIQLFGFASRSEREAFEVILGISGLGPRLGIAILSFFSLDQLVQIIMTNDAARLKHVPGIGLKKAEKILLELKGRVDRLSAGITPSRIETIRTEAAAAGAGIELLTPATDAARDAVAALESLDLSPIAARRAVAKAIDVLGSAATSEALVREGLRHRHL